LGRSPQHQNIRVGYLNECFDETKDPITKTNNQKTLDQLRALGFQLIPIKVPDWNTEDSGLGIESAVFFDEFIRTGRDKQMTNPTRAASMRAARLVPAVEYLQSQRARSMMMAKLAAATSEVDVYLAPADRSVTGADPDKHDSPRGVEGADSRTPQGPTIRHFNMANIACYPALAAPNGFNANGTPGSIIFYGRPFAEAKILTVAKAWQDSTNFHLKHPDLDSQPSIQTA